MCKILDKVDVYVSAILSSEMVSINGEEYEVYTTKTHQLILFGDQLRVARICSASIIRSTTDTGALDKFKGFIPAIANWHARANFLDIST